MGIPSYFSQIIKNYSNIIRNMEFIKSINIDHLFMDCNSIIYDCVREIEYVSDRIEFEKKVIDKIIEKIEEYVNIINPKKTLFIAFDGVAPFAKMEQQRTRRYKTYFMSNLEFNEKKDAWNTSAITPGTNFMNKLSDALEYSFSYIEKKFNVGSVLVSTSKEEGEGEHKLFEYLRKNDYKEDNVFLYGLDSDLIMLSIYHLKYCKHIFIFREAPEFLKSAIQVETKSDDDIYFLDILHLKNSIVNEMSCVDCSINRAFDYIFLCFFLGNDFLPHFPAMNIRTHGIDTLLRIYRNTVGNKPNNYIISQNEQINWKNVRSVLKHVADDENKYLISEYELRRRYNNFRFPETTSKEKEVLFQNSPIIYRHQENYINPDCPYWENRYYKTLFKENNSKEFVKNVCNNYLEGLEWVYKYYTSGCIDWKWKYNYHYPPLFKDLIGYIPHFEMNFLNEKQKEPFNPYVQLCYVLPMKSHFLLPNDLQVFISKNYKQLYPDRYFFEWAFCRYFWESHPILPKIPLELLNQWNTQFNLRQFV